ncbi:MAG: HAMP domain-containing histidine kinase [Pseudobutyrivibrio sp.]|nr:HAMP domain-containing histidine kinase [Pseudobutyrivibrio sp.]
MKSYLKFVSKHLSSLIFLILALIMLNIFIFIVTFFGVVSKDYGAISPRHMLSFVSENSTKDSISDAACDKLRSNNIWAAFIDNSGIPTWTMDEPKNFPSSFSMTDVAIFSKGYLLDYPVFIEANDDGLLILGYPKDSYFKIINNSFSTSALRKIPLFCLIVLFVDCLFIFLIYYRSKGRLTKNIEPILDGIENLSKGEPAFVNVGGDLKNISESINQASNIISRQNTARANWISGVSHDIRTPLSIILGYSDKIKTDTNVDSYIRNYSEAIETNCLKIKQLVSDLNLVSMLEYDMQPLQISSVRFSKLLRSFVADTLNSGISDSYSIELSISEDVESSLIECDSRLITRALSNLVNNSINHNTNGCNIFISLTKANNTFKLVVSDDGVGISEDKRKELEKPHYMKALDDRLDLRHGLGTLIVKQIIEAHQGHVEIPTIEKGYMTILYLNIKQD